MNSSDFVLKLSVILAILFLSCPIPASAGNDKAGDLAGKVVESSGGLENLYSKKDIEYVYIVRYPDRSADISVERYIFDGELSWGKYVLHENLMPDTKGTIIQGFNGNEIWASVNGEPVNNKKALKETDFLRKTNYYWLTMMFKLTDPGTNHEYMGVRRVKDKEYETVKLTFDEGTGDAQDTYLLYINPDTMRVDRFLFTVMDFGVNDPLLMEMEYESLEGLLIPVYRRFTKADWEGNVLSDKWTEEITVNPRFNNGFSREMFDKPSLPD